MAKPYKELAAEVLSPKRVTDISIVFNNTVKPSNLDNSTYQSFNSETVDTVETFNEKVNKNKEQSIEKVMSDYITEIKTLQCTCPKLEH